jgi:hypothetical protein
MTLKQEKRKSNHPHCSFPPPAAEVIVPAISTHREEGKGLKLTNMAELDKDLSIFLPHSPVHKPCVSSLNLHGWSRDQPEHLIPAPTSRIIVRPNPAWFHSHPKTHFDS